jgi:hypothetical protein
MYPLPRSSRVKTTTTSTRDPLGRDGHTPTSRVNPRTSTEHIEPNQKLEAEIVAIVGPPDPDVDWRKQISEYLRLGAISDDETKTQCLTCWAKGYLIHNDELYQRNTSGILQRCIPQEEGKALLLDIDEGVCGHHASSRSMAGKAFRQRFTSRQPLGTRRRS